MTRHPHTNSTMTYGQGKGARIENYVFVVSSRLVLQSCERQHGASTLLLCPQCAVGMVGQGDGEKVTQLLAKTRPVVVQ